MAPIATSHASSSSTHKRTSVAHHEYLDRASLLNPPSPQSASPPTSASHLHTRQPYPKALRISPDPPTLLAFASSFQTLLDSQAPVSSTHSAYSELLSVSTSTYPPSTLPITALVDLVNSNVTPSTSSSKSSISTLPDMVAGTVTTPGLDLLGILAEEVDWDPQQKGSPADQLSMLGHVQSHHQTKQRLWAGHIFDSLGLTSRRNSFATLNAPLKPISPQKELKGCKLEAEDPLNTMILTKRTALFYENIYEQLCPGIVPRAYVYPRLGRKEHDHDAQFAALALSLSLLGSMGLILPKPASRSRKDSNRESENEAFVMPQISERSSKAQPNSHAMALIEKILQVRQGGGAGVNFGQAPTTEGVLTSFFLSLALYNLDDATRGADWKDASFFRFCEAVTLAKILGLDRAHSGEEGKVRGLLVRAERWWASQRDGYVCQMDEVQPSRKRCTSSSDAIPSKRPRSSPSEPLAFIAKLGFPSIRADLLYRFSNLVTCFDSLCVPSSCPKLTATAAIALHDSLATLQLDPSADPILIDLTRQTLRAQLWTACLAHNLVSPHAQAPLRPDQPLHIALDTLDLLEDLELLRVHLPTDQAQAIQEAVATIRGCVSRLPNGLFAAEQFSFEQMEGDDGEETAKESATTIGRAALGVIENLDRFLNGGAR
ncbi:hypothetical protein PSEUBRA_000069 [Kalmanozyma brasiliensis GHG001]|uniref:Transcription factor domain-containing protein n=1 Tax=Kalmanozyma brasiliensis (strain GHG001) TaxID=1365824 RepID=V5EW08_KALBG|nr:uncharacterized protein PSEUBRA_000069 [Kalmanozyma brasiliensis GHG001]EST09695.1 hypothetical protein PSEUBRA_000069 [Kalmanozyma brasiliensis GHG001]